MTDTSNNQASHKALLSIVLPVRNRQSVVVRTLDSIAAQDFRPIKLIIVDNGSTDSTPEVINEWVAAHKADDFEIIVASQPEQGAARARNKGLTMVDTEYVMFFDSDDVMEHDHISRIDAMLTAHKGVDLLYWSVTFRDPDGWTSVKEAPTETDLLEWQIMHCFLGTQRYCIRTSTLRQAGAWNDSLSTWDDYELGIRLLCSQTEMHTAVLNGTPRVIIDTSDDSLTGPSFSSRAEAQSRAIDAIEPLLESSPIHSLLFHAKQAVLAANYRREGRPTLASETLENATKQHSGKNKLKLQLIYAVQRLVGSGATSLAQRLFKS